MHAYMDAARSAIAALALVAILGAAVARSDAATMSPEAWRYLAQTTTLAQAPPPANIAPGTTVSTTGPVTSSTTIETGTLAGQALMWVASVFGTAVGSVLVGWLYRLFKVAGITATDAMRARLQQIVVNGLNAGAAAAAGRLEGKGSVAIKQPIVAEAVRYVQEHGKDELKALGVDPSSNAAVDAIKARIETAITDPTVPTPAVLTPPPAPQKAV